MKPVTASRKAFRQLRQLDAFLQGEHQECACAVAYAAAALLWFPEEPLRVGKGAYTYEYHKA